MCFLQLDISVNQLCGLDLLGRGTYSAEGIHAIADALRVCSSLTAADVRFNVLHKCEEQQLRDAVKDRVGFDLRL